MNTFSIHLKSLVDTFNIASIIAPRLRLGDLIILEGDLAAGKTYLVKAFAKALGSTANVTSPTYAIANFHTIELGNILHIDAYRLSGISEFRDLGLDEYYDESITFVEWGKKLSEEFPEYLLIQIQLMNDKETHRKMEFSYHGKRWAADFVKFEKELSDFLL